MADRSTGPRNAQPRRYVAVLQDPRGYPAPGQPPEDAPPDGPFPLTVVSVVKADDHEREQQRAFYRGWTQAMELIEGSGDTALEIARDALQPCRHDASTGGICDWCGEDDDRGPICTCGYDPAKGDNVHAFMCAMRNHDAPGGPFGV